MSLVSLIILLVIVGVVLYCINTLLPIDAIVIVLAVCLWLLQVFGIVDGTPIRLR